MSNPSATRVAYWHLRGMESTGSGLRSPASPRGDVPLTQRQEQDAWEAGYEAGSYFYSKGNKIPEGTDVFLWVQKNDRRVPRMREEDPSFWEWVQAVTDGAAAFAESVGVRFKRASTLDGMTRKKVADLVNHVIARARLTGMFRDQYWKPIQGLWKAFEQAGIPFSITKSEYEKENGVPVRKVWQFEVNFMNERGRPTTVYGRVVAAGAGPVDDPLEVYDVTAYAN